MTDKIVLKGFVQINSLIDNHSSTVAPVGEMSPISKTFSREQAIYTTADAQGVNLIALSVKYGDEVLVDLNEGNLTETLGATWTDHTSNLLEICEWVIVQAKAGRFSQNVESFRNQFITQWGEVYTLNDSGFMVAGVSLWCPGYIDISWNIEGALQNTNKIWFASEAFDAQYDDYEIVPVPPITDLDNFFTGFTNVKNIVKAIKLSDVMENVNIVKDGYPETTIVTNSFEWVDPINSTLTYPVDWTVVVYGPAGENLDSIKEAIIAYVLQNSTHTRTEWEVIFPDIFTATEFIITPMWNNYSIPNRELETGLYSPVVSVEDAFLLSNATAKGTGYTSEHVRSVLQVAPNPYKSLALSIIGGPKNRNGINRFNLQFKDYLSVASTHLDFRRMNVTTRDFVFILSGMLKYAEAMTLTSSVPREHTRAVRDGIVYLSRTYDRVQYLVVTKYSLNDPTTGIPDLLLDGDGYELIDEEANTLI
jgi:hypothetical protein